MTTRCDLASPEGACRLTAGHRGLHWSGGYHWSAPKAWKDYDEKHPVVGTIADVRVLVKHARAIAMQLVKDGVELP